MISGNYHERGEPSEHMSKSLAEGAQRVGKEKQKPLEQPFESGRRSEHQPPGQRIPSRRFWAAALIRLQTAFGVLLLRETVIALSAPTAASYIGRNGLI